MPKSKLKSPDRRAFLTQLATGSATIAAASLTLPLSTAAAAVQPADTEPMTEAWLARLNGKHRQFFDAMTVNGGFALAFAMNFLNSNNDTYKLPDSALSAVVGFRHFSIPMAFTDDIWARYKLGEFFGINDPATKAPATRNFLYHPHDGDVPFPGMAIEKLLARGVQMTCCNVALGAISGMTSKNAGVTPDVARAEWLAALIPGIVVVPSGVLAVNRAQEKGCSYCNGG